MQVNSNWQLVVSSEIDEMQVECSIVLRDRGEILQLKRWNDQIRIAWNK